MTVAVVVICPTALLDTAVKWGEAGLIADSFWVSSDDAGDVPPDRPNSVNVVRILPGEVRAPSPLAQSLAELGALDEVRVAWIRPPADGLNRSLTALEHLLRELLPPDTTQWLDIVVPTRRTDRTVAALPGHWVQMRVLAEDRSAPDVTDAGWDLGLDVALHAALAAVGVLGGTFYNLPWSTVCAEDHHEFRVFSRLILGAVNTDAESRRFVAQTIPTASAGAFFPDRYLELDDEGSMGLVDRALRYMMERESSVLSYRDPASSQFASPPRLTVREHIVVFLRFLGMCLRVLAGILPKPKPLASPKFDVKDLGYNVGPKPTYPVIPQGLRPADFDVLDNLAADEARRELEKVERELSEKPLATPARAWHTLIRLATCLNDGGVNPDGWNPLDIHDRRPVVAAAWVQPSAPEPMSSRIPELAGVRSARIATLAANDAGRRRNDPLMGPAEGGWVVATAQDLADEGNDHDRTRLNEQLAELDAPRGPEPISFLDRLSGRLVGAGLRARLDAERWTEFATARTQPELVKWTEQERKFRKRILIGLGAGLGSGAVWAVLSKVFRGSLPAWLTMSVGLSIVGAAVVACLLWCTYQFFKMYSAHMERGRRRLEMRRIWLERSCIALRESARLREPRRLHGTWLDVLGAIFPYEKAAIELPDRPMPDRAPKGTAIAVPVYTQQEMTKWLADEGAEAGWRLRAFEAIAAGALHQTPADAVKRLVEDSGLKGGPLHDVWERRSALWRAYADALRFTTADNVAERMVGSPDRRVSLLTPDAGRASGVNVREFHDEPWPPDCFDPEMWDNNPDFAIRSGKREHGKDAHANPDTCLMSVRIQLRRIDILDIDATASPNSGESDDGEVY